MCKKNQNAHDEIEVIISDIKIPFDDEGMQHKKMNIVRYVNEKTGEVVKYSEGIWRDRNFIFHEVLPHFEENFAFEDDLIFEKFQFGNRNMRCVLISKNDGLRYYMNTTELNKSMCQFNGGILSGIFSFKKKGEYYTIYKINI